MNVFVSLYRLLSARQRRQFLFAITAMILAALADMVAIGAIVPFLSIAMVGASPLGRASSRWVEAIGVGLAPLYVSALLLVAAMAATAIARSLVVRTTQRFVAATGHDLALRMWDGTLSSAYAAFVRQNSSTLLAGMEKVRPAVYDAVQPAMQAVAAAVAAIVLIGLALAIDWRAATIIVVSTAAIFAATSVWMRRRLLRNSNALAAGTGLRIKLVQEGLGTFRDVVLYGMQKILLERFRAIDRSQYDAIVSTALIAAVPRYFAEIGLVAAIALVAVITSGEPGGIVAAVPKLGALALAGQRLSPLILQVYAGWSQARGNLDTLADVLDLASVSATSASVLAGNAGFSESFESARFDNVAFEYITGEPVLANLNFNLLRGERVGVVGPSGSGKSTLLDLLMGLLEPSRGCILINGCALDAVRSRAWHSRIGHVPQSIYLTDETIAQNIALGVAPADIDQALLHQVAACAGLTRFVADLPEGFATKVGERGVRLSGGQRQRVGIARALYRSPSLLVLDEATSALDVEAEREVLASIARNYADLTLVVVAHRASGLATCDRIFRVDEQNHAAVLR